MRLCGAFLRGLRLGILSHPHTNVNSTKVLTKINLITKYLKFGEVVVIILALLIIFKLLFLTYPDIVLTASRSGLLLWFNNVMPALLPFMVITNMLMSLGFAEFLGKFLSLVMQKIYNLPGAGGVAFIVGLTSGYPIGAKAVTELRKTSVISVRDAQHLLAFCNNAGPLFILGVVGIGFFGNRTIGYILWTAHIFAALVLGILLRNKNRLVQNEPVARTNTISFGKALGGAVKNAMESMAVIGGLIIFFNTVVAVLSEIGLPNEGMLAGWLAGLIEVTGGLGKISADGISTATLAVAAFVIAFGGFSIHMQTLHFTEGTGIKAAPYIFAKFLHGLIAAAFTILLWTIFKQFV